MKNILIIGAAGFIGSHLYNYFKTQDYDVLGVDNFSHTCGRKLENIHYSDIRYYHDIKRYVEYADVIFHLGAIVNVDCSIHYPHETMDTNLMGTMNILDLCKDNGKTLIFAGSSEIYGGHDTPISENHPTYAQSPYAVSKLAADKLCGNYHQLFGTRVFRARFFNCFGPWQNDDEYGAVIPKFVKNVLNGKPPVVFGDGEQRRDFLYIDDAIRAYKMIPEIEELNGEPVNIGTGKSVSVNEIAEMVLSILGRRDLKPIHVEARPGEVRKLEADIALIKKYGWEPKIFFEEGLKKYIEWYREEER